MFDFANSSYTTMIVTFAYSVYFVKTVVPGSGYPAEKGDLLWGLGNGVSQAVVLITAPVVGAIADFSGAKKRFLLLSYLLCVGGTACLGFVGPGDVVLGLSLFIVSNIFYSCGENLVAAFLPEIAATEDMGRISGTGWALGYMGGLASLAACYPFLRGGLDEKNAPQVRESFLVVALFFFLAGLPTFLFLRERARPKELPKGKNYVTAGFYRVHETLLQVRRYRQLFRFLVVFLAYTAGINIVVSFSNIFAEREIKMTIQELLMLFIFLQVSGSLGAVLFGFLQDRVSSKVAIQLSLLLWVTVCVGAYFSHSKAHLYVVGNVAGLAMGSAQSAGRALVGTFSPKERNGEFFGFWGLFWKLSAVIGPPFFGWTSLHLGIRNAILVTTIFFVLGIVGMFFVDEEEGKRAARTSPGAEGGGSQAKLSWSSIP
jgi:UMF1 family MFS transporter